MITYLSSATGYEVSAQLFCNTQDAANQLKAAKTSQATSQKALDDAKASLRSAQDYITAAPATVQKLQDRVAVLKNTTIPKLQREIINLTAMVEKTNNAANVQWAKLQALKVKIVAADDKAAAAQDAYNAAEDKIDELMVRQLLVYI
jgi:chromosome segregation ATPase